MPVEQDRDIVWTFAQRRRIGGAAAAVLLLLVLLAFRRPAPGRLTAPTLTQASGAAARSMSPVATQSPANPNPPSGTPQPSATATIPVVGPDYVPGYNPLTGLPVKDPRTLLRIPLLVSVSEFPPSARPQAGLSAAAQIWETSIGEGMSRFLAVYYGDYFEELRALLETNADFSLSDPAIGPIRSGRVGYQEIKLFYPEALLIIRYGSPEVIEQLTNLRTVYADDPTDVNSAALTLAELEAIELEPAHPSDYAGLSFDPRVPLGGRAGASLDLVYSLYDQIRWEYDPGRGTYLRSQDRADGNGIPLPSFDRLTGDRLQAENVMVMFADHAFQNLQGTIVSIELAYVPDRSGLLFRDGRQYAVEWSSRGLDFRVKDEQGRVVPFKPGVTFFEVVSFESSWDPETRTVRFHNPPLPTLTITPTFTPTGTETPTATEPAGTPTATATSS